MFMTTTAASVWQTLLDDELRDMTRGQFRDFWELRQEDDFEDAWADFEEARERVFGVPASRPFECAPPAAC